ncbi:peptide IlvX [Escherichia coli]|nr:hypothetical protein [Escherichia coli]
MNNSTKFCFPRFRTEN